MRAWGPATVLALTLVAGLASGVAVADEDATPTRQDVRDARQAARDAADTVAGVRAELVVANQRLQDSATVAAQAAEAFNGARWRADQARQAARDARERSRIAARDVRRQQQVYGDALVSSYQLAPELSTLAAIVDADGIDAVVDRTTSLQNAESALDANYDSFRAAATLAEVATDQAEQAEEDAIAAEAEAKEARDAAQAAADRAAADAAAITAEKDALLARLASLQGISLALARERQSALEAEAQAAAAATAQEEQEQQGPAAPAPMADPQPDPEPEPDAEPTADPQPTADPDPDPGPTPDPQPAAPAAPAAGASAALAFARAQIGEPYRWGAAGPSSWDCSGLTMGAWAAGGKSLPHYSVAQYEQSTPISAGQLQPGDLVFWGSSSSASSIYHVALYVGNGTIVHAPRTGRPVTEESMYYWIPPTHYARP